MATNRIINAIETMKSNTNERIAKGIVTAAKVEDARKRMDLSMTEYVMFQERKSHAVAAGKLTMDEGVTIYRYLGEMPETFNGQEFAVKMVLNKVFAELIQPKR